MSKIPDPTGKLDPIGQKIYDIIHAQRSNRYPGLFTFLIYSPAIALKFAEFKDATIEESALPSNYREFAMLLTAARLQCQYVAAIRLEFAKDAGLSDSLIHRILQGETKFRDDPLYNEIVVMVDHLIAPKPMPQPIQDRLVDELGYSAFVQLSVAVALIQMEAMWALAFEFKIDEELSKWLENINKSNH